MVIKEKERKLGVKGAIVSKREKKKKEKLKRRKRDIGIECLWTSSGNPEPIVFDSKFNIISK